MSKTTLALNLLTRLSNGGLYKKKELAEALEVSERKLIDLRYELIDAGFYIETIPGRYGGYRLDKNRSRILSTLNITDDEFNSIKFISKTINNQNKHHQNHFSSLIKKIELRKNARNDHFNIINPVYGNRLVDIENEHFAFLVKAIKENSVIRFKYKKVDSTIKVYTMNPYELFFYKGFWYLITYNEKYQKAYQYKLVRMNEIEILEKKYKKSPEFKLSDFTGDTSVFKNEMFEIELEIKPPRAVILSELMLAKDQEIITHSNGNITFKGIMEGRVEIISWLLSLGDDLLAISPPSIKDAYLLVLENMTKYYLS